MFNIGGMVTPPSDTPRTPQPQKKNDPPGAAGKDNTETKTKQESTKQQSATQLTAQQEELQSMQEQREMLRNSLMQEENDMLRDNFHVITRVLSDRQATIDSQRDRINTLGRQLDVSTMHKCLFNSSEDINVFTMYMSVSKYRAMSWSTIDMVE